MKPADFLQQALAAQHQRGKENGYDNGEERSAAKIAEVFNKLTGHTLTEADAWTFLIVLKLVRNSRKYQRDNIVDLVAYGALLGECLEASGEDPAKNTFIQEIAALSKDEPAASFAEGSAASRQSTASRESAVCKQKAADD